MKLFACAADYVTRLAMGAIFGVCVFLVFSLFLGTFFSFTVGATYYGIASGIIAFFRYQLFSILIVCAIPFFLESGGAAVLSVVIILLSGYLADMAASNFLHSEEVTQKPE